MSIFQLNNYNNNNSYKKIKINKLRINKDNQLFLIIILYYKKDK